MSKLPPNTLRDIYASAIAVESIDETVALENQPADGQSRKELEYVFYGKIVNFDQLSKADTVEHQEQWEVRNKETDAPFEGNVRVRKSWKHDNEGEVTYILCAKTFLKEGKGRDEVEMEATADMFEQFKRLATGGMIKTRYTFPIEHEDQKLTWEVDVYQGADDKIAEWCKIDLEVPAKLEKLPEFPIELTETITTQYDNRTAEEKAKVDQLMKDVFVCKNPYLTKTADTE